MSVLSTITGGETGVPAKVLGRVKPRKAWQSSKHISLGGEAPKESTSSDEADERRHQASAAARGRLLQRAVAAGCHHQRAATCAT